MPRSRRPALTVCLHLYATRLVTGRLTWKVTIWQLVPENPILYGMHWRARSIFPDAVSVVLLQSVSTGPSVTKNLYAEFPQRTQHSQKCVAASASFHRICIACSDPGKDRSWPHRPVPIPSQAQGSCCSCWSSLYSGPRMWRRYGSRPLVPDRQWPNLILGRPNLDLHMLHAWWEELQERARPWRGEVGDAW